MNEQTPSHNPLQDVTEIKKMMERSSRFTSLSGLSCIAAGICALAGAWLAYNTLQNYYEGDPKGWYYSNASFALLKSKLLLIAGGTFLAALLSAFFFTWRKAQKTGNSLTDHSSKKVFWSMAFPLLTGGIFVLGMLQHNEWRFVASSCLVFYGLSLVSAGRYTLADLRSLGYCQILLGLINLFITKQSFGYGLYFWVIGFGILHIIYGILIWWKHDRN